MQGAPPFLGAQKNVPAGSKIKFLRHCQIAGHLYDLGRYPGFIETAIRESPPLVQAELYEILDAKALSLFDEYEGYYPNDHNHSYYLRKSVQLIGEEITAWCYIYNQSIEDYPLIESGCWRSYSQLLRDGSSE